ncbi:hypothetical protein M8818_003009 [Zalaria obscura]|uniref:Uncharacterized protein n=1 Tax=Zalaria obscura TaxID=2024903 RepID=A0ACC3SGK3_9PEZI
MQPWALISPTSRGIGLEVARRLLKTTEIPIVATARKDLDKTREQLLTGFDNVKEDRLHVLKLDVLDESSIAEAATTCSQLFPKKDNYLHLGFVLTGLLFPEKSPTKIDYNEALLTFQTNTLGPLMMLKHFDSFLPRKSTALASLQDLPNQAVWATMSARVGSISDNRLGGWYSYRASKAGVNQITKTFDNHLRIKSDDKAIAIALHPGTVKTGLSHEFWGNVQEDKLFSAEFSAEKLLDVIRSRRLEDRGKCWDWKGEEVPP